MDGIGNQGTYAEYSLEGVCSGTQMGNGAQILKGVAFLLQRVIRCGGSLYRNFCGLDLKGLLCLRRSHQSTLYNDSCSYTQPGYLLKVLQRVVINGLQRLKIGSIADDDEAEGLGISQAANPAADGYFLIHILIRMLV